MTGLVFVTQYRVSGILLLLLKGIHCDAKKSLEQHAFPEKSEISLLLIKRGGMIGTFLAL